MKRVILLLTLASLICLTNCGTSRKGKLPSGVTDWPLPNSSLKGPQVFFGWAISEDNIKSVEVYLDRNFLAEAQVGVSRPDVNKALPGYPTGDNAGWRLEVNAKDLPAGSHQLVFEATTRAGAVGCIGERAVAIVH